MVRWLPLAGLSLVACTSANFAETKLAMHPSLSDRCVGAVLEEEPGMRGLRHYREKGDPTWSFELDFDHASGSRAPGFTLRQSQVHGGWMLRIDASFYASRLRAGGVRTAVSRRSQDILATVVRTCGGGTAEFDPAAPCGKGESRTVCVSGESR